jgi:hypothetical protein
MEKLTAKEYLWLRKILTTSTTWEHKIIASRFVMRILTTQRKATETYRTLLKNRMIIPYSKLI